MKKDVMRLKFSLKPTAVVYEVNGSVDVRLGENTPRTTMYGKITRVYWDGSRSVCKGNRWDRPGQPTFLKP